MRRLCLSGFRLVALFCCLVAPPFAVHDAHNQDERQHVANLALFQQRLSASEGNTSNMSPIKKLSKRDDKLSSYGMSTSSTLWTTSHCRWLENVFYRNIRQWASSGHQVTVEANRHRLPNLLRPQRQEVTYTTWLINDDDSLTASTVTVTLALAKQVHHWQSQR